jgi:segregation and condensation protein B
MMTEQATLPQDLIVKIIEGALFAADKTLSLQQLSALFLEVERPSMNELREAIAELQRHYENRALELKEVASGFRFQVRAELSQWMARLWEEKPPRYSRAILETLVLIAYRQPITRAEIEEVRGVTVSTAIVKTLQDREWIRVVGQRDVPGKPSLYATTRHFLDYFNLRSLDELPTLAQLREDFAETEKKLSQQLEFNLLEAQTDAEEQPTEGLQQQRHTLDVQLQALELQLKDLDEKSLVFEQALGINTNPDYELDEQLENP